MLNALSFIDGLDHDSDYVMEIAPNFWIMDNHKWAFWAWEKYRAEDGHQLPTTLVHVDKHWDAANDWKDERRIEELLSITSLGGLQKLLTKGEDNRSCVRLDSFIAPSIIRGIINHVDFYCLQTDTERGLWPPFLEKLGSTQILHESIDALVQRNKGHRLLFDLDIDIFNRSDMWCETDHWSDDEVLRLLDSCAPIIRGALVVTVAISFGFSGDDDDARRLAKLVIGRLLELREA